MSKTMLIAGCSHTVGAEIDGTYDSAYNRQHSYGNLLAEKLGYTPVNIAMCGYSNSAIARSVLEWFSNHNVDDVFVLIGWTDGHRLEAPYTNPNWASNKKVDEHCDWFSQTSRNFLQVIAGTMYKGDEEVVAEEYRKFILCESPYMCVLNANLILQIQYFLKSKNVDYLMCNTGYMYDLTSTRNKNHLKFYTDIIDKNNYLNCTDNDKSFYRKYKDLGLVNPKSRMSHHGQLAHELFAKELYDFMKKRNKHV